MVFCFIASTVSALPLLSEYSGNISFNYNISPSMGSQTNYQMKFILSNSTGTSGYYAPDSIIYTNGATRPDWFDVNATDGSGTPFPFWIENNTRTSNNATAYVNVPTIASDNSSTGRWYFGNSTQSASTMNGQNTFLFFDDFNGPALNTSIWKQGGTGYSTTFLNGYMVASSGGTNTNYNIINSTPAISKINTTIKARFNTSLYGVTTGNQQFIPSDITPPITSNYSDAIYDAASNNQKYRNHGTAENFTSIVGWSANTFHTQTAIRNSTGILWLVDNSNGVFNSGFYNVSDGAVTTYIYRVTATQIMYYDWVFVKKSLDIEPVTSTYTSGSIIPINASFTQSANPSSTGQLVTYTDTSTGSPTTWNWTLGGIITNTTQNAGYIYSTAGVYTVNLTVTNSTGAISHSNQTHTVNNATGFTPQDIYMQGQYAITFLINDADGNLLSGATVTDSNGQSNTTGANGVTTLTEPFGTIVVNAGASGYYGKTMSYVVDSDASHTITLTKQAAAGSGVHVAYPVYVVMHFVEGFGTPVSGVNVTAIPYTTSTSSFSYLAQLLGLPLDQAPMQNQTMTQLSGTDGKAAFYILPTTQYNFSYSKTGYTFTPVSMFTAFSNNQDMYIIATSSTTNNYFPNGGQDVNSAIQFNVAAVKVNATAFFLNMTYSDSTGTTTGGNVVVIAANTTPYAANTTLVTWPITSSSCTNSTLVIHTKEVDGDAIANIVTTQFGTITKDISYTMRGQPVSFMGFGPEIALLFAIFIMMMTVMLSTSMNARQIVVGGLAFECWIFYAIGWFDSLIARGVPETLLQLGMVIMTVAGIISVFEVRKKKEKY